MGPRCKIVLFLPHLDVSGGLGVHCRMLLAALNRVRGDATFLILAPAQPQRLFPDAAIEPMDRFSVDHERFQFQDINVPAGFNLANPLDEILSPHLANASLLYCSYYTGMAAPPCPQIITFHDAGFLDNPAGFGATAAIRLRTIETIRGAISQIHCISQDARDRICAKLNWPVERTRVVWHALPDSEELLSAARSADPTVLNVAGRSLTDWSPYFFLPVGAATGFNRVRKNVPTAIRAFRRVNNAKLLIAGTAPLTEKVLSELLPNTEIGSVREGIWHSNDGAILILPSLDRLEFLAAMRNAACVLYPSRYEGFGLPTLEAMALGVPLIASRATSIPEIVGNAGLLIDPDDLDGFASAMAELLTLEHERQTLIARGLERVKIFTFERLGREMTALFSEVACLRPVQR